MTVRTRRVLFYIGILLFFIVGTGIVFYAGGWRLDLAELSFKKVGAIYVRSYPAKANIFLNGLPVKNKSWLLQNGTLINDLFPKQYTLRLEHEGFEPWEMNLNVEPSLVTEVKLAVLIPEKPVILRDDAQAIYLFEHEPLVGTTRGTLLWNNRRIQGNEIREVVEETSMVLSYDTTIKDYILTDIQANTSTTLQALLRQLGITPRAGVAPVLDKLRPELVLFSNGSSLSIIDRNRRTITPLITLPRTVGTSTFLYHGTLATSRSHYAWSLYNETTNTSQVAYYNTFLRSTEISPAFPGKTVQLTWSAGNRLGILQDDGSLYIGQPSVSPPDKYASDVRSFAFSDDGSNVAALEHRSLEIFSTQGEKDAYQRFNLPDADRIVEARWHRDDQHLFLLYPEEVMFLDLRDTGLQNYARITPGWAMEYDPKQNYLYVVQANNLLRFEFAK